MNKREHLLKFAQRSNCATARFVREAYPQYIKSTPLKVVENSTVNDEIIRISHQSHTFMEENLKKIRSNFFAVFLSVSLIIGLSFYTYGSDKLMISTITKMFILQDDKIKQYITDICGVKKNC